MQPFFYARNTNFGDHMNSWLWKEIIPDLITPDDGVRLVGIGSLLSRNLDLVEGRKVIFGTGSGYSSLPDPEQARRWKIYCVRGPLTARYLGLDERLAIVDGAWLINMIPRFSATSTQRKGAVFVPHWSSATQGSWEQICARSELNYINPLWSCERVFSAIAGAELAIVESLHGAIIADYYRTPWIPVASPSRILKYKWIDWCKSVEVDYSPFVLPPSDYLDCLMQKQSPNSIKLPFQPLVVPDETFDVPATPLALNEAKFLYHMRRRARKAMHHARNSALERIDGVRNSILFRGWNEAHWENVNKYLMHVKTCRPNLSSDKLREEKISKLNEALNKMRDDYVMGRL